MLSEMGWNHSFEHATQEGISLDLADREAKRAIEVDGPSHYLRDVVTGKYVVNGPTQFKSRLLRALGWQVTHVPFFDWNDKTTSERRHLLTNHLAKIGVRDTLSREKRSYLAAARSTSSREERSYLAAARSTSREKRSYLAAARST